MSDRAKENTLDFIVYRKWIFGWKDEPQRKETWKKNKA